MFTSNLLNLKNFSWMFSTSLITEFYVTLLLVAECAGVFFDLDLLTAVPWVSLLPTGAKDRFCFLKAVLCFSICHYWNLVGAPTTSCSVCLQIFLMSALKSFSVLILVKAL